MGIQLKEFFIHLVRLGIGAESETVMAEGVDWHSLKALAERQGLSDIVLDGIDKFPREQKPQKKDIIQWIGATIQKESQYAAQQNAASEMAQLFHQNGIRTYVLKGTVVSECYPKPEHRKSVDMDCFLASERQEIEDDVWERGNRLVEEKGFAVKRDFYKNSTFYLPGLTVENHRFMTPWRGNRTLRKMEIWLQEQLTVSAGSSEGSRFEGTWLWRPPVMVSSLFLVEHAFSHFLHEGMTWRMVLDWMLFSRKHKDEIDEKELGAQIDEFGFRRFYDSFVRIGKMFLGEISESDLSKKDKLMLDDIWAPLDLHESVKGWRGKLALAGNTWRARWKYRHFSEISWLRALWIQTKGVLFEKEPKLS